MAACPYQVRYQLDTGEVEKMTRAAAHRVEKGLIPACVGTCVTKARLFGDMNDPESDIAKSIAREGRETLYPDLGLDPALGYVGLSDL